MDGRRRIIYDGAVAIQNDLIVDVGKTEELKKKYSADQIIDARRKVVMPGLTDTHAHADELHKTVGLHEPVHDGLTDHLYRSESTDALYWEGILSTMTIIIALLKRSCVGGMVKLMGGFRFGLVPEMTYVYHQFSIS